VALQVKNKKGRKEKKYQTNPSYKKSVSLKKKE